MRRHTIRLLAIFFIVLLLQSGCAVVQTSGSQSEAVVSELAKSTRSWDGALLPPYPQGQPEVTILRITIPPGMRLETHTHPVINGGVLLNGQLTVKSKDGGELHLRQGDPIVEVVNTWHYGVNEGSVPAELIMFYAGTVDLPISIVEKK